MLSGGVNNPTSAWPRYGLTAPDFWPLDVSIAPRNEATLWTALLIAAIGSTYPSAAWGLAWEPGDGQPSLLVRHRSGAERRWVEAYRRRSYRRAYYGGYYGGYYRPYHYGPYRRHVRRVYRRAYWRGYY